MSCSATNPVTVASLIVIVIVIAGAGYFVFQADSNASSLSIQVTSLEGRPAITVTSTQVVTSAQTSFITSTSTVSVYPVPKNASVAFINVDGSYNYQIVAGPSTNSGSQTGPWSIALTNLFQGETIAISVQTTGVGGCRVGEMVTVQLIVNGQVVGQSATFCGANQAQINYII